MPRVTTHVKSYQGRNYNCTGCGKTITPGEEYYAWRNRNMPRRCRHTKCGRPRPSELSNAKTAAIEDAIVSANQSIDKWEADREDAIQALKDELGAVAETARGVGEEYAENAENLPMQGAQYDAMTDVASRLEDWANEVEGWEPDTDQPPEDPGDWPSWEDEVKQSAKDAMEDMPTYEG